MPAKEEIPSTEVLAKKIARMHAKLLGKPAKPASPAAIRRLSECTTSPVPDELLTLFRHVNGMRLKPGVTLLPILGDRIGSSVLSYLRHRAWPNRDWIPFGESNERFLYCVLNEPRFKGKAPIGVVHPLTLKVLYVLNSHLTPFLNRVTLFADSDQDGWHSMEPMTIRTDPTWARFKAYPRRRDSDVDILRVDDDRLAAINAPISPAARQWAKRKSKDPFADAMVWLDGLKRLFPSEPLKPASTRSINMLEERIGRPIPDELRRLFQTTDGLHPFSSLRLESIGGVRHRLGILHTLSEKHWNHKSLVPFARSLMWYPLAIDLSQTIDGNHPVVCLNVHTLQIQFAVATSILKLIEFHRVLKNDVWQASFFRKQDILLLDPKITRIKKHPLPWDTIKRPPNPLGISCM